VEDDDAEKNLEESMAKREHYRIEHGETKKFNNGCKALKPLRTTDNFHVNYKSFYANFVPGHIRIVRMVQRVRTEKVGQGHSTTRCGASERGEHLPSLSRIS